MKGYPTTTHVRCRGVATRVGSVHFQWTGTGPEGRGQNTPTTAPSSSSRMPILQENRSTSEKTMPGQHQKAHNDPSQLHNPLPARVEQVHSHTISNFSQPLLQPHCAYHSTWVSLTGLCLTNGGASKRSKVTPKVTTYLL